MAQIYSVIDKKISQADMTKKCVCCMCITIFNCYNNKKL